MLIQVPPMLYIGQKVRGTKQIKSGGVYFLTLIFLSFYALFTSFSCLCPVEPLLSHLSSQISSGGSNKKSTIRAIAITIAVNSPMPEFNLNDEVANTKKPATRATEVTHKAIPTVEKA